VGKPYSQDLRERVISSVDGGMAPTEVAELFRVDVSYVYKILIRRRRLGITTALPWAAGPRPKLKDQECYVGDHADATLEEIRAWLVAERGIEVSIGCLWNTLDRLRLPLKKSRSGRPSRTARISLKRAVPGMRRKAS
jgi:transposase